MFIEPTQRTFPEGMLLGHPLLDLVHGLATQAAISNAPAAAALDQPSLLEHV